MKVDITHCSDSCLISHPPTLFSLLRRAAVEQGHWVWHQLMMSLLSGLGECRVCPHTLMTSASVWAAALAWSVLFEYEVRGEHVSLSIMWANEVMPLFIQYMRLIIALFIIYYGEAWGLQLTTMISQQCVTNSRGKSPLLVTALDS